MNYVEKVNVLKSKGFHSKKKKKKKEESHYLLFSSVFEGSSLGKPCV
jgi:hypothetical protein